MATPLLRLRSDEQLVTLFRNGQDEAFRVIHDRYHKRLSVYARQMLPRAQDAEEAVQDVFIRAYTNLGNRDDRVANLRAWLYRTAHNRCIDELRRPPVPQAELQAEMCSPVQDPVTQVVEREALRRVLRHVQQLPAQQRSALLLRELDGANYADIAIALETTVPAVKSLLIRARMSLASSIAACEAPCSAIRNDLTLAHDRGVRPSGAARAHLRECSGCRAFRAELRGTSRQLAGLVPTAGPLAALANVLGLGGASGGGGAAIAGGGGAVAAAGITSGHVATLIAAAVVTAGGAIEIQSAVVTHAQPSDSHPAVTSSPLPSAPVLTPRVAAPTLFPAPPPRPAGASRAATTPRPQAPARVSADPTTTSAPSLPSASPSPPSSTGPQSTPRTASPTPIRQPSLTGINVVSTPSAAPTSAIGHTSITGTADVSVPKSSGTSHSDTSSGAGASLSTSTSTSSGAGSTPSAGDSSHTPTLLSSYTTDSGSSPDPPPSS